MADVDMKHWEPIYITSDSRSITEEAICDALSEEAARAFHAAMEKARNGEFCKLPEEAKHPLTEMDADYINLEGFSSEAVGELMKIHLRLCTKEHWNRKYGMMRSETDGAIFDSHLSGCRFDAEPFEPCTNYIKFRGRFYEDGTIGFRFSENPESVIRTQIVRAIMREMVANSLPLEITIDLDELAEICTKAVKCYGVSYDANDAWREMKEFFMAQSEVSLHWAPVREGRKRPSLRGKSVMFYSIERIGTKATLRFSDHVYGMFGIVREKP